jgi:hypothetical protein
VAAPRQGQVRTHKQSIKIDAAIPHQSPSVGPAIALGGVLTPLLSERFERHQTY